MRDTIGLTTIQVIEVTGRKRAKDQCAALAQMRIPFRVRHDGTPFVAIADISLAGKPVKQTERNTLISV